MSGAQHPLERAESGISNCPEHNTCDPSSDCSLTLSDISPGARRRGSRNPRILLVTEAPDESSSEGTAYQGSISSRIQNIFCKDEYGIGLGGDHSDSFPMFLDYNKIYATSAVKCCISEGAGGDVGRHVINTCTNRYLREQIEAMPQLELILPMGVVATAGILRQSPDTIQLTSLLGRMNRGILPNYDRWDADVIVFPHPSGASPLSNPPIIEGDGSRNQWKNVNSFRSALKAARDCLGDMGYDVLNEDPTCWDSPSGLSRF